MTKQALDIIKANKEALEQGLELLSRLSNDEYTCICKPSLKSTIGQHIRHVADMYFALMSVQEGELVDYDVRRRGSNVELHCSKGIDAFKQIMLWLDELAQSVDDDKKITIKSEVSLHQSVSVTLESSLLRELVFVGSHTVHHYAVISVIAKLQGLDIAEWFGVAPATVTFLRNEVACAQ